MRHKNTAQLPKQITDGPCSILLAGSHQGLILQVKLPEIFSEVLPRRMAHINRRINRVENLKLTAVNFYQRAEHFGLTWDVLSEENLDAASSLFRQLRASVFRPVTSGEAPKLLGLPACVLTAIEPLPTLRIPCQQHGKRYSILGWRLSEFLVLADRAKQIKATEPGQPEPRQSAQEVDDNV